MQNTIGKFIEKIIVKKFSPEAERLGLFPSTLGGYRPHNRHGVISLFLLMSMKAFILALKSVQLLLI
jgi:hypothetical protein